MNFYIISTNIASAATTFFLLISAIYNSTALMAGDQGHECKESFAERVAQGTVSPLAIEEHLLKLHLDRMALVLEKRHLDEVRKRNVNTSLSWQSFYPHWIFQEPSLLEELLEYFDPTDPDASPEYQLGYSHWIKEWETAYRDHIGPLARRWTDAKNKGRKLFLQKLLTHAAVRHALRLKLTGADTFLRFEDHQKMAINLIVSGIQIAFAKEQTKFRRDFKRLYRKALKARLLETKRPSLSPSDPAAVIRKNLRTVGAKPAATAWKPALEQHDISQAKEQFIQSAVTEILKAQDRLLSYEHLFIQTSNGDVQGTVFIYAAMHEVDSLFSGIKNFLKEVNHSLEKQGHAPVQASLGTRSLVEEMAVQLATLTVREKTKDAVTVFTDFQTQDPKKPWFISINNPLFETFKDSLDFLSKLVKQRILQYQFK